MVPLDIGLLVERRADVHASCRDDAHGLSTEAGDFRWILSS